MKEEILKEVGLEIQERVKYLFETFHGVKVAWIKIQPSREYIRFGLAISNARSLSRLVHISCIVNVPLHVEVDWSCCDWGNHDDPDCVRYDFRIPLPSKDNEDEDRLYYLEEVLTNQVSRNKTDPVADA